jgi:DNA-binding NtrC family response regulator
MTSISAAAKGPSVLIWVSDKPGSMPGVFQRVLDPCTCRMWVVDGIVGLERVSGGLEPSVVVLEASPASPDPTPQMNKILVRWPQVSLIVLDESGSVERAVEAMRFGAFDYVAGSVRDLGRVRDAIRGALSQGSKAPERADKIPLSLAAYERRALERALNENAGDVRRAARCLGIGRSTFYRKASKLGLIARGKAERPKQTSRSVNPGVGHAPLIG